MLGERDPALLLIPVHLGARKARGLAGSQTSSCIVCAQLGCGPGRVSWERPLCF